MTIVIYEQGVYNIHHDGEWHRGLSHEQAHAYASEDDLQDAYLRSLIPDRITYDGRFYHFGPMICRLQDTRRALKDYGVPLRARETLLHAARFLYLYE